MSQLPTLLQIISTTGPVVETLHKYVTTCGGKSDAVTEIVREVDTLNAAVDWLLYTLPGETVVKVAKTAAHGVGTITIMDPLESDVIEHLKDSQNWIQEISAVAIRGDGVTVFFKNLMR